MPATSVKFFHSSMPGAPTLTGAAGSLIALLDACLINGFGLKTVDSLVVSGGVATATISSGHSFEVGSVALIAGATPSALNGEWRVAEITATAVKFNVSGVPDGTAAGTITIKVAPLGWIKQYSGTNVAVYKRSVPEATAMVLRVDDTGTLSARVRGFESMSDVTTGLGPFPTDSQVSGGLYWDKSSTTGSAVPWVIAGDERAVYVIICPRSETVYLMNYSIYFFGDVIPNKSGDAYGCALFGYTSPNYNNTSESYNFAYYNTNRSDLYVARSESGVGGSVKGLIFICGESNTISGAGSSSVGSFPNRSDNGLIIFPMFLLTSCFRGKFPGVYSTPQYARGAFNPLDRIDGTGVFSGRQLRAITVSAPTNNSSAPGVVFLEMTGPWR